MDSLPDLPLHTVLGYLDRGSLMAAGQSSKRISEASGDEALWTNLCRSDFGDGDAAYVAGPAFKALGSSFARHSAWSAVRRRFASQSKARLEVGCASKQVVQGPVFCCNAIGNDAFLVSGGSSEINVVRRDASILLDHRVTHVEATGAFVGSGVSRHLPNHKALSVDGEWTAMDEGMLGMSYDPGTQIAVAGSFGGRLKAWKLNYHELQSLESVPAKRLKAILQAKGVPTDDIYEKAEFIQRIKTYRALPLAVPAGKPFDASYFHDGTIVSVSNRDDICVSGGNDGHARVWRISTGACLRSLGHAGAPLPTGAGAVGGGAGHGWAQPEAVDSVHLNLSLGTAWTGDKNGRVRYYDVESGKERGSFVSRTGAPPEAWIWALKDCAPLDSPSSVGTKSSSASTSSSSAAASPSSASDVGPGARLLLVGATDGILRLADSRQSTFVHEVRNDGRSSMMRRAAAADYDSDDDFGDVSVGAGGRNPFFGGGAESNRAPISGLCFIPSFGGHSFVTSSFDGCVRIWDLRALTSGPTVTLRGSHDRLTRVDASSDIIAAGCMDGSVRMWDFRPERSVDGGWAPLPSCNCNVAAVRHKALPQHQRAPSSSAADKAEAASPLPACTRTLYSEVMGSSSSSPSAAAATAAAYASSATSHASNNGAHDDDDDERPSSIHSSYRRMDSDDEADEDDEDDFAAQVAALERRAQEEEEEKEEEDMGRAESTSHRNLKSAQLESQHWPLSFYARRGAG